MRPVLPFDWREVPFVRLLLPLLLGFVLSKWFMLPPLLACLGIGLCVGVQQLYQVSPLRSRWNWRFVPGILFFISFLFLGTALPHWKDAGQQANHIRFYQGESYSNSWLLVRIIETPEQKAKSLKVMAEARWLQSVDSLTVVAGKLLLYLQKDTLANQLQPGDLIWLPNRFQTPEGPANPGAFDYRNYLFQQQIYVQAYVASGSWQKGGKDRQTRLKDLALALRTKALKQLHRYLGHGPESGLAAALIFGYRAELPPQLVQAYANSGAIHVLAVSGLHTGILYLLLQACFKPLRRIRKLRLLPPLLVLVGLWAYALVAGLPPSVNRAATMCSFMVVAGEIKRKTLIYNTLAATAFFLLLLNPVWLYYVGFQLSFFAVLGIVFLQKRIYGLWTVRNKFVDYLWQLTAVAFAAQLLTMPLGLYYFHQFPTYFWLSNWLVIPLATVLLGGGLLLLAVSPFPFIANLLGKLLYVLIYWQNKLIVGIDQLPAAVWSGWSLTFPMLVLLFLAIVFSCSWLIYQHRNAFWLAWLAMLALCGLAFEQQWRWEQQNQLTLYHLPKKTAFSVFVGRQALWYGFEAESDRRFVQQAHLLQAGIHKSSYPIQDTISGLICINDLKILRLTKKNRLWLKHPGPLKIDYLILSGQPYIDTTGLRQRLLVKRILVDGSNSRYYCSKTLPKLRAAGFKVSCTWDEGALILPL